MNDCNVELQDPFYHSDLFMMFCFKILPCKKTYRHDWRVCPFAHGDETAKRRDPRLCKYTGVICPDAKKGRSCPRGDDCPCTHSLFEYWLHPTRFKTEICSRGSRCNRPFCFFAHKQSEIRKPNFRLQMQGVTCEAPIKMNSITSMNPTTLNRFQGLHSASENSNLASNFNLNRPSSLFEASSLFQSGIPRVSLEEGGASVQDSGSSCDLELPCATWNSLIGGPQGDVFLSSLESPRLDSGNLKVNRNGVPVLSMPLCPMLPQIPTMERNSVDWYSIPPSSDSTFQLSSARGTSSTRMSENRRFGGRKSGGIAPGGISPRLLDKHPTMSMLNRSFNDESLISNFNRQDSSCHSGYDRHFLLATIQDVYQSMVSGGNSLPVDSNDPTIPAAAAPLDSDFNLIGNEGTSSLLQQQSMSSFGMGSTQGIASMTGNGGNTCGIEGLQHNRCLSSSSLGSISGAQRSNIERMISTLLQTDSDPMSRYFN